MFDNTMAKLLGHQLKAQSGNVPVKPPESFTAKCIVASEDFIKDVPMLNMIADSLPLIATMADDSPETQVAFTDWFMRCRTLWRQEQAKPALIVEGGQNDTD